MDFVELAMLQRRCESLSFHGDTVWTADERGGRRVPQGGLRGQVAAGAGSAGVTCVHSALRHIGAERAQARRTADRQSRSGRGGW